MNETIIKIAYCKFVAYDICLVHVTCDNVISIESAHDLIEKLKILEVFLKFSWYVWILEDIHMNVKWMLSVWLSVK